MATQQTLTANLTLTSKKKFIFEMDYRTMYHNVKSCNEIALNKLIKARRSADYWKSAHAKLVDALWGWTSERSNNNKCLYTPHPMKAKTKNPRAATASFTFPAEDKTIVSTSRQPPSSPTRVSKRNSSTSTPSKAVKRKIKQLMSNDKKSQDTISKSRIRKRLLA